MKKLFQRDSAASTNLKKSLTLPRISHSLWKKFKPQLWISLLLLTLALAFWLTSGRVKSRGGSGSGEDFDEDITMAQLSAVLAPVATYAEMDNRPLFVPGRRPQDTKPPVEEEVEVEKAVEEKREIALIGVLQIDGEQAALVREVSPEKDKESEKRRTPNVKPETADANGEAKSASTKTGGKSARVRPGDEVFGWTIKSIGLSSIQISDGKESKTLYIERKSKEKGEKAKPKEYEPPRIFMVGGRATNIQPDDKDRVITREEKEAQQRQEAEKNKESHQKNGEKGEGNSPAEPPVNKEQQ